ncbi:Multidrug resistance-associated protein 1 [Allomyces javanicus]|nr:Multidrug resistance-associated protein 1 [Allomyces javanicus]
MADTSGYCGDGRSLAVLSDEGQADLTLCFQEGVILPVMALLGLAILANRLRFLQARPDLPAEMTGGGRWLLLFKMVLSVANLAVVIATVVVEATQPTPAATSTLFGWISLCLPFAVANFSHHREHYRSRRASSSLSSLYLLTVVVLAVRLRTLALHRDEYTSTLTTLAGTQLGISAVLFIAENFSSKRADARDGRKQVDESPELTASYLAKITFWWVLPLLSRASKTVLTATDLWDLPQLWSSRPNQQRLQRAWEAQMAKRGDKASFARALAFTFGPRILAMLLFALLNTLIALLTPKFVEYFVGFVVARGTLAERPLSEGLAMVLVFIAYGITQSVLNGQQRHIMQTETARMLAAIRGVVYHKIMAIPSHDQSQSGTTGNIVNHCQVDASRIVVAMQFADAVVTVPFGLALGMALMYQQVGWSMMMVLAVMALLMVLMGGTGGPMANIQKEALKFNDTRVKLCSDALTGIKTYKLYGWTKPIADRILAIREKQLLAFRKMSIFISIQAGAINVLPTLSVFAIFLVYGAVHGSADLTVQKVFVVTTLYRLISGPLQMLAFGWAPLVEASVSIGRISKFLNTPELATYVDRSTDASDPVAISVKDAQFAFVDDKPVLAIDQLDFARGSVTAVVGRVGAGKTALLNAILGEVYQTSPAGRVTVRGTVAYASQKAWILNASLRDNILFGLPYDEKKYRKIIEACALKRDLAMLVNGDQTLIGDKGINLSGGQRARLNCARALYADADLFLLDDPLSAVDAHVDRHLFDAWFNPESGLLRGKTVVLVTHAVHHLPDVDRIVAVQDGKIAEVGTYVELMAREDGVVADLVREYMAKRRDDVEEETSGPATDGGDEKKRAEKTQSSTPVASAKGNSKVENNDETKESGSVGWSVYISYLRTCGWFNVVAAALFSCIANSMMVFETIWLGMWGQAAMEGHADFGFYIGIYAVISVVFAIGIFASLSMALAVAGYNGSRGTFAKVLQSVMHAPGWFFDTTPAGRILNRMASDQDKVDLQVPLNIMQFAFLLIYVFAVLVNVVIASPWFVLIALPIGGLFVWIERLYLNASREVQRLFQVSLSPVFQHVTETLDGLPVIRGGFRYNDQFEHMALDKIDDSGRAWYASTCTTRWLNVQVSLVGNLIMGLIALLAVLVKDANAALMGSALSQAFVLVSVFSQVLISYGNLENALVSVERINEYMQLPAEAPEETTAVALDAKWPVDGSIDIDDYSTTYREGLDPVLKHVSVHVRAGERVGIVGRTGAGKSSLTLALFRIIEATSGRITIDGLDIAQLGLQDLRTRLTILPQDPIIFHASVRDNLDPTGANDDAAVWRALDSAGLADFIRELEGQLDAPLTAASMSVGQSQLLCLARALLRKTKILVLDEATASVDPQTDEIVQKTIRREFAGCTILTIAHRVATVMDYDKILTLDHGKVVEFDSPEALLADQESVFYSLAKESKLI